MNNVNISDIDVCTTQYNVYYVYCSPTKSLKFIKESIQNNRFVRKNGIRKVTNV